MKTNMIIGLMLVFLATNIFTYAATRYWTVDHVISAAHERVKLTMQKQQSGEMKPSLGQSPESQIFMAISMTEGLYHGENSFIFYCWLAPSLFLTGIYFVFRKAKAT